MYIITHFFVSSIQNPEKENTDGDRNLRIQVFAPNAMELAFAKDYFSQYLESQEHKFSNKISTKRRLNQKLSRPTQNCPNHQSTAEPVLCAFSHVQT
jgi:hypothetical protein